MLGEIPELRHKGSNHCFAELDGDGIPKLALDVRSVAVDLEVVREGHEAQHLVDAKSTCTFDSRTGEDVFPVKGANPWTGLGLQGGRGTVGVESQEEGPVTATPFEAIASTVAVSMPEVVLPRRDLGR